MATLRFLWNGIKGSDGKLQRAHYSIGNLIPSHPFHDTTITIWARDYKRFSAEVGQAFTVENDTDSMTDYFENDRIRVLPTHPLYAAVHEAVSKQEAHQQRRAAKRAA